VCAGYCIYSTSTELLLSFGQGVSRYTLDANLKDFLLADDEVMMPRNPREYYSINEGYTRLWDTKIEAVVNMFKHNHPRPYALRYTGSMVADVHRTIAYGGIFMYPADKERKGGKLHLLYECAPIAMLIEQSGGEATTGMFNGSIQRLLEIEPMGIHEQVPIVVGCLRDMDKFRSVYRSTLSTLGAVIRLKNKLNRRGADVSSSEKSNTPGAERSSRIRSGQVAPIRASSINQASNNRSRASGQSAGSRQIAGRAASGSQGQLLIHGQGLDSNSQTKQSRHVDSGKGEIDSAGGLCGGGGGGGIRDGSMLRGETKDGPSSAKAIPRAANSTELRTPLPAVDEGV
jgi:Fructose-1-6-bisphosphatase, C-terminal domain